MNAEKRSFFLCAQEGSCITNAKSAKFHFAPRAKARATKNIAPLQSTYGANLLER